MPTQRTITLYTFPELEQAHPEAAERVLERAREREARSGNPWDGELRDALKASQREFGWDVHNDYEQDRIEVQGPENEHTEEPLQGIRLWKWAHREHAGAIAKDCPWTGWCYDESFLDPLRKWLADPRSIGRGWATIEWHEIIDACRDSLFRAWNEECEWRLSDECLREELTECLTHVVYDENGREHDAE